MDTKRSIGITTTPVDLFERSRIAPALERRQKIGSLRKLVPFHSNTNAYTDFSSNDYLGLSQSQSQQRRVDEAYSALSSAQRLIGSTGSRLLTGDSAFVHSLEERLAKLHNRQAALVCNSGYDANLAVLSTLSLNSIVLMDELSHNSLVMGVKLSRGYHLQTFRHNSIEDLEKKLMKLKITKNKNGDRSILVVVESVYSMDGDIAPLKGILDMALRYNACAIVDEAHGFGVFGDTGTGVLSACGLEQHPTLLATIYTYGKAGGCHGALVCGSSRLKQFLYNYGRPIIYSTSLPLHSLISIQCSYDTVIGSEGDMRRRQVNQLIQSFRMKMGEITRYSKISLVDSISPIQALVIPGNDLCVQFCETVWKTSKNTFRLYPIRSPTVPKATMVSFRRKKKEDKAEPKADKKSTPKEEKQQAPPPKSAPAKPPTLDDIPELIETMLTAKGEKSAAATKRIYELCDVGHKQNRVPMVCSGKHDVLTPLARCLTQESGDGRHLACLALNNLSIPTENKRVMALGPASKEVIGGLCKVIAEDKQESYLCCICLMNLSFLEASITSILQHSPVPDGKSLAPLENPQSLLRVLEKLLTNSPGAAKASSGKSEGVRWACGLIKNLAKSEENAALIGKTEIPKCVVENIRATTAPPSRWTSNSLEDFSLFVILNLAQWPVSRDALIEAGAVDVIKPIMAEGDLQGLKATMASAFLEAEWSTFPDGGNPAAKAVSDLMTNIVEKKGKDGQYAYGVFKLYTATKAYADLSIAANKADRSSGGESNTKVLAAPSAVALNLQIVSDLVLSAMDDAEGSAKYVPDAMSAEHAVTAIEAMLPAILQGGDPPRKSVQSEQACGEVSQMLLTYADISGTSSKAKTCARSAAEQIKGAASSARPVLEISHDLWTQYRKREGQPMDQFISQDKGIEVDESGPLDFLPCANSDGGCTIV